MRTGVVEARVLALLLVVQVLALPVAAHASRTEEVLYWDSDSPECLLSGSPGDRLAVKFHAPEWAVWVTEIRFYIHNDFVDHPVDPWLPTTESFVAYVWSPTAELPAVPDLPVIAGVDSGTSYPEDAWLHLTLPEPVNISDPSEFPDRTFFVGLEWLHMLNPFIGDDAFGGPVDYKSYFQHDQLPEWQLRVSGDAMVRAVVCDSLATPVEGQSWSGVKAMYR
jgi:hypothetical protein